MNGHRVDVKWIRKEQDLPGCQLIFVSRSEARHYDKVLEAMKNSISLTVGEDQNFLEAGGMLSLQATHNDAVFDVFQDDFGTGANFDDRFVPGASRTEPNGAVNGTFNTGG